MAKASVTESTSSTSSLLKSLMDQRPAALIKQWNGQFQSLIAQKTVKTEEIETILQIEIRDDIHLTNGWRIFDKLSGRRYVMGRQTTAKTINQTLEFFVSSMADMKAVVSLSLPDEGPLGERGVAAFDDYSFWPLARNESRAYSFASAEEASGRLELTVDSIDTFDDESVISKIDIVKKWSSNNPDDSVKSDFAINSSLCHVQHLNWPPDGYPPMCTFSVLRTIAFVHQDALCGRKAASTTLVTCSNGGERSGAFAVLCCCVHRLDCMVSSANRAFGIEILFDMVAAVRSRCPFALQRRGTYLWLNYAVVEFYYASTMQQRTAKEEKAALTWLLKLRKAVYQAATVDS